MNTIVMLSGSPAPASRSEKVLRYIGKMLDGQNFTVKMMSVREVSPETLFHGDYQAAEIVRISECLARADGVIVVSPVYQVSLTGILKTLLDLLPRDIFKGKPVLPIMVGGTEKHFMALDYALKPVLSFMKGELLQGVYVLEKWVDQSADPPIQDESTVRRIKEQIDQLIDHIRKNGNVSADS